MTLGFELAEVSVERGGVLAVRGVSYANEAAGWIGIVGANGSGKTSLLRAIAGRLPIRSGRILIGGADLSGDRAARAAAIGFAVDAAMLPGALTPREVFAVSARERDAMDAPALAPLREALGIDAFLDRSCGALSAGMGQRVAIFAAFLDLPRIVILDEPFNWLDPLTAFDVKAALGRMVAAEGLTLLTALHDVATLTACCSRGLLMAEGGIALTIEEAELRTGLADPIGFEAAMIERLRSGRD
ncbi:MAG TPA: ATP-binding cassette domain-containing protein [Allosphingosinicella sp.]|jgi:ABC-type multidrug transport system ATPase subunit